MVTRRLALGHADFRTQYPAVTVRPAPHEPVAAERQRMRRGEIAAVFLRLGLTAFGGPAAHIAMMEDKAVVRRKWLTRAKFSICSASPTSSQARVRVSWRSTSGTREPAGPGCSSAGRASSCRRRRSSRPSPGPMRASARSPRSPGCSTASGPSWWRSSSRRSGDSGRRRSRTRPRRS